MKKFFNFVAIAFIAAIGLVVASCGGNDDNPTADSSSNFTHGKAKYTIMFYGCGGSDVDYQFEGCIQDVMKALGVSNNQVRFTVFYSMSQSNAKYVKKNAEQYKVEPYYGEYGYTYRFELTPQTNLTREGFKQYKYKPASEVKLKSAQTIADFITWTKQNAPAENYILMPVNHGGGFDMDNEYLTRAICYDDNTPDTTGVSTAAFAEALRMTDTHLKAIYWYGCLMGQAEVLTGVADYCDYQFASTHVSVVQEAHPVCLVKALNQYPNSADFEKAALYDGQILEPIYVPDFQNVLGDDGKAYHQNCDFGCWRSSSMTAINEQIKKLKDILKAGLTNSALEDKAGTAIQKTYLYEKGLTYVDVVDLADNLAYYYGEGNNIEVKAVAAALKQAIDNAYVYRFQKVNIYDQENKPVCPINGKFGLSISMYSKNHYTYTNYGGNYQASLFDQKVKWSEIFAVNEYDVSYITNPCNNAAWELKWLEDE